MAFNSRNSSVRRIFKELAEIRGELEKAICEPGGCFCAVDTVNDNLFELHFTIRGPPDTPFELGCYHGKLILPHDYPFKPPEITFLTPNGRFEVKKKLCLSVSDYHPESWQPAWGLRTVLIGISSFMSVESAGSIGSVVFTKEERENLARESIHWVCPDCKKSNMEILPGAGKVYTVKQGERNVALSFDYQKGDKSKTQSPAVMDSKNGNDFANEKNKNKVNESSEGLKVSGQSQNDGLSPHGNRSKSDSLVGNNRDSGAADGNSPKENKIRRADEEVGQASSGVNVGEDLNSNENGLLISPQNVSSSSSTASPAPSSTALQLAAANAALRAARLQQEEIMRRQLQEARTLRSRIDLLIIVLLLAVVFKLVT